MLPRPILFVGMIGPRKPGPLTSTNERRRERQKRHRRTNQTCLHQHGIDMAWYGHYHKPTIQRENKRFVRLVHDLAPGVESEETREPRTAHCMHDKAKEPKERACQHRTAWAPRAGTGHLSSLQSSREIERQPVPCHTNLANLLPISLCSSAGFPIKGLFPFFGVYVSLLQFAAHLIGTAQLSRLWLRFDRGAYSYRQRQTEVLHSPHCCAHFTWREAVRPPGPPPPLLCPILWNLRVIFGIGKGVRKPRLQGFFCLVQ